MFEPNIWSSFNLVNFDVLIEKLKKTYYALSLSLKIKNSIYELCYAVPINLCLVTNIHEPRNQKLRLNKCYIIVNCKYQLGVNL